MQSNYETKLWGGRFEASTSEQMEHFHNVGGRTAWLLEADILGSIAHARMLTKCGLVTPAQGEALDKGLNALLQEARKGTLHCDDSFEDVHSFVELTLTRRIGDAGKVLHTARSRNDQVNLDMKLFARQRCADLQ
ncbi:MAG: argininosuccinate lyase, partial [Clostridiales bacterium]|nr:argininosuccinate lyase [Clostridiales bacterium]